MADEGSPSAYRGTFKPQGPHADETWPMKNENFRKAVPTPYGRQIGTVEQLSNILNGAQKQADEGK